MRINHRDLKQGTVKVTIENLDDLWYLSHLIDPHDRVKGRAERKVKLGKETEKQKIAKKRFWVTIDVEKVDFEPAAEAIRLNGTIVEAVEDAPKGSHQAIEAGKGDQITIIKDRWLTYHLERLDESTKSRKPSILICVHDREEAIFALFRRNSYEILAQLSGQPQKKDDQSKAQGDFYMDIITQLQDYQKRHSLQHIVLASPAFFKEDLMKKVKDNGLRKSITLATCSSVSKNAIQEVLRRDEVKQVLQDDRLTKESLLVEELLGEISTGGKAAYGMDEVGKAVDAGAVSTILVTDVLIQDLREKGSYERLDTLLKSAEQGRGKVHIISGEHEAGRKLDGLGGLAALLRYRISY